MQKQISQEQRREFLLKAASMLGVTICGPVIVSALHGCNFDTLKPADVSITGIEVDLKTQPALQTIGGAIRKTFGSFNGGRNVIIVRQSQTEFLVVTAVCNHQGCDINAPLSPGANMICPCHGAQYSSKDGTWQPSPQQATNLKTYPYKFDAARNVLILNPGSQQEKEPPASEVQMDISQEPDLQTAGGAVVKNFYPYNEGGLDVIVIRHQNDAFLVVTSACSRDKCHVDLPQTPGGNMICPCDHVEYSSIDGTWQSSSPLTASDLRTFVNSYNPTTKILTIYIA